MLGRGNATDTFEDFKVDNTADSFMQELWSHAASTKPFKDNQLPPTLAECVLKGDNVFSHYFTRSPFTFVDRRGNFSLVIERPGRERELVCYRVYNATGAYGTSILGGTCEELLPFLIDGVRSCPFLNDEHHSPERAQLCHRLKDLVASHQGRSSGDLSISFFSTGTEAVDFALQLVAVEGFSHKPALRRRSEKDVVISCHGSWHGWAIGPTQLLDRNFFTDGIPRTHGTQYVFMHYGQLESLEAVFDRFGSRVRAVFAEGVLGDGGVVPASDDWWKRLIELANSYGARVIVDEILSGFRTGSVLAMPAGVAVDCVLLGKALGFGLIPISAVLWDRAKLDPRPGLGVRTFNARPLHARFVVEGLRLITDRNLFERSKRCGKMLAARLSDVLGHYQDIFKSVRHKGLLIGVELSEAFSSKAIGVRDELIRSGVLTEVESGLNHQAIQECYRINKTIRMTPPLTIEEEEIDWIEQSFSHAAEALRTSSFIQQKKKRPGCAPVKEI